MDSVIGVMLAVSSWPQLVGRVKTGYSYTGLSSVPSLASSSGALRTGVPIYDRRIKGYMSQFRLVLIIHNSYSLLWLFLFG